MALYGGANEVKCTQVYDALDVVGCCRQSAICRTELQVLQLAGIQDSQIEERKFTVQQKLRCLTLFTSTVQLFWCEHAEWKMRYGQKCKGENAGVGL